MKNVINIFFESLIGRKILDLLKFFFYKGGRDTAGILAKTEKFCVKITKILVIRYVIGYCSLSFILGIINMTACYMQDNYIDRQCLYTPYLHM